MKFLLVIIIPLSLWSCMAKQAPHKTGLEGQMLPECSFLLEDSTTYINQQTIEGKMPFVLFYFSPHCPYCRAEMRDIINNEEDLKGIRFYALTPWTFGEMRAFAKGFNLSKYDNISVGIDYQNFFIRYFKPSWVPLTAVYGADKRLRQVFTSMITAQKIREAAMK